MENLIKALQILLKYGNPDYPFQCEHDMVYVCGIDPDDVTGEDTAELKALGFVIEDDQFVSYKYGSA